MRNKIKELRQKHNLTQVAVAKVCGCHWTTIKMLETHQKESIQFKVLKGLSKAFGCPLENIFDFEESEKNE